MHFPFRFDPVHRNAAVLFGITPGNAWVDVADGHMLARYGLWALHTPLDNVAGTQVTGPYTTLKTMGPARLSVADFGLTFASNGERGLCISFREPVPGMEPTGRLRHPALTVTVDDVEGLARALGHPAA